MPTPARTQDITRTVFAVLFIGGLIAGSLWILRPFLPAVIWATMIVVASWPVAFLVDGPVEFSDRESRDVATAAETSGLLKNDFYTLGMHRHWRAQTLWEQHAGCSKRPSSKAAASEEAKRTFSHPPNPGAPRRAVPRARPQR